MSPSSLARRHARRLVPTDPATVRGTARTARTARTAVRARTRHLLRDDAGMSTVEYAIGCIAAAAFAAVLYAVVSGDSVVTALTQLVQRALTAGF
jgi:hypothetical protein